MRYKKIGCVVANSYPRAEAAFKAISQIYDVEAILPHKVVNKDKYDLILSIGGDGTMLRTIHSFMSHNIPIYGINRGSFGFLLNEYELDKLFKKIEGAEVTKINPLEAKIITNNGEAFSSLAINEVSMLRQSQQTAHLEISINGKVYLNTMVGDGIIISTPTGSSAYNFAARGPIVPLDANILIITPISPFRPRRWHGAIIPKTASIKIRILEPEHRPASASADFQEFKNASEVKIECREDIEVSLLFDKDSSFNDRIIREQFMY